MEKGTKRSKTAETDENREAKFRRLAELVAIIKRDGGESSGVQDLASQPKMSAFIAASLQASGLSRAKIGTAYTLKRESGNLDLTWTPGDNQISIRKKNPDLPFTKENVEICSFAENPVVVGVGCTDEDAAILRYVRENADLLWNAGFRVPFLHNDTPMTNLCKEAMENIDNFVRRFQDEYHYYAKNRYVYGTNNYYLPVGIRSLTHFAKKNCPWLYTCDGKKRIRAPAQGSMRYTVYVAVCHFLPDEKYQITEANYYGTCADLVGKDWDEAYSLAPWLKNYNEFKVPEDFGALEDCEYDPHRRCALHGYQHQHWWHQEART